MENIVFHSHDIFWVFLFQEIGGRAMKVNFPQSNKEPRTGVRSERPARIDGDFGSNRYNNPNKLFVGNLAWGVDDVTLAQLFSDFGNVVEAKVVYDRDSGRSRGFGFVTYGKSEEVTEAIQNLDGAVSSQTSHQALAFKFLACLCVSSHVCQSK